MGAPTEIKFLRQEVILAFSVLYGGANEKVAQVCRSQGRIWEFPQIGGYSYGGPWEKDYGVFGVILGNPL